MLQIWFIMLFRISQTKMDHYAHYYSFYAPHCYDYLIQNSPTVKKVCGPKKAIAKKGVKSKVAAKKWL